MVPDEAGHHRTPMGLKLCLETWESTEFSAAVTLRGPGGGAPAEAPLSPPGPFQCQHRVLTWRSLRSVLRVPDRNEHLKGPSPVPVRTVPCMWPGPGRHVQAPGLPQIQGDEVSEGSPSSRWV